MNGNKKRCPSCGELVEADCNHCTECGKAISGTPTPAPQPDQDKSIGDGRTIPAVDHSCSGKGESLGGKTVIEPGKGLATVPLADRYEIIEEINRGGMGVVYKARDIRLECIVAVKRILPESASEGMVKRFRREKNTIANLNHQSILSVNDAGEDEQGPWLAMECALPEDDVIALGKSLCSALSYAHKYSPVIIHRDVKPNNVLLLRDGTPKLSDFGLAREGYEYGETQPGSGMGAPLYAAPEQLEDAGRVDHRADIYGLGKTLYYLVTGEKQDTIRESAIPERFRGTLMKALARRPEDRFYDIDAMAKSLKDPAEQSPPPPQGGSGNVCPNQDCGAPTTEGEKYCERCGTGLYEVCPRPGCGNEIRVGKSFCGQCGLDLPAWKKAEEHLSQAKENERDCEWGESASACRAALEAFPEHEAARELLQKMDRAAEKEKSLWEKALALEKDGDLEEAIKSCEAVLAANPHHVAVWKLPSLRAALEAEKAKRIKQAKQAEEAEREQARARADAEREEHAHAWKRWMRKVWTGVFLVTVLGAVAGYYVLQQDDPYTLHNERIVSPVSTSRDDSEGARPGSSSSPAITVESPSGVKVAGFKYRRDESFSCGGQTNTVEIYCHDRTGLEFVLVPGGSFMMGSPSGEPGRYDNEGPMHRVSIEPFLICRTECTQAAWDRIGGDDDRYWSGADLPIETVSWDDCTVWCEKAGLRLPTESEWEYACRAGSTGRFCFGDSDSGLGEYAWHGDNSGDETHPVGKKKPNAFGLFDTHGNVWEWCSDKWHDSYSGAPDDGTSWESGGGSWRVDRGGCWFSNARRCRSAFRARGGSGNRSNYDGFRPARSIY